MKKVEEVIETKELVKPEAIDMVRDSVKKVYDNLHDRMSKDSNRIGLGLALAIYFVVPVIFKKVDER